ncbi:MAG: hypothetical protein JW924_03295 [Fusobacteriaceae bacterium]|nr:hypothetical protein [Fusobacteriaceae bacterium]
MAKKKMTKEEMAQKLAEFEDINEIEPLIKNNIIEFLWLEKTYRIRKPTIKERLEVNRARAEKKVELLQTGKYKTKIQLIDIYKEQGIDILKIDEEIIKIQKEHDNIAEKAIKVSDKIARNKLREEMLELRAQRNQLSIEKADYLEGSLEQHIDEFSNSYLLCQVFEVQDKDKWIKVFKNYEELANSNESELIFKATQFLTILMYYGFQA